MVSDGVAGFGALIGVVVGLACALAIESGLFWADSWSTTPER